MPRSRQVAKFPLSLTKATTLVAIESIMSVVAVSPLAALDRWLNDAIPTQETSPPDSVIMRNLAYDILRTWPRSRDKVGQYIGVHQPGTEEAIYGKHFLKRFYEVYQRQRWRLKH